MNRDFFSVGSFANISLRILIKIKFSVILVLLFSAQQLHGRCPLSIEERITMRKIAQNIHWLKYLKFTHEKMNQIALLKKKMDRSF